MELKHKLEKIFNDDYPGTERFIADVIEPIFGNEIENINDDLAEREKYAEKAKNAGIKHIKYIGDLTEKNYNADNIALLDVTLDDSKNIERSRVNIQQLIRSIMDYRQHLMIIFHYEDVTNKQWRFSYAYKGDSLKDSTSAKRYTYVFGKDYRGRTAAERFEVLAKSPRNNEDFEKAFSVAALSDEFFDLYRAYYAVFVEYITGEKYTDEKKLNTIIGRWNWLEKDKSGQFTTTFDDNAKDVRDYIKKMFGRIVFLYFLQRKGWLYDAKDNADARYMRHLFDGAGDLKNTFLDDILELLFFYVLNTKPEQRVQEASLAHKDITILPGWEKIPFLNGGLFSQDDIDPKRCVFPAIYFDKLFEFLDSYNFTIDENDQEDAEVGIDPEMLGRIFENLLEDNKDKGAFYTPKDIVDYMCRESIIAYLQDDKFSDKGNELIREFIETLNIDLLDTKQRDYIEHRLLKVKICDPAIGSGAFPMGLVNLLSKIFIVLRTYKTIDQAKMKRHIMQQSIYGVDIEQGAVDIARLRFWLAMVVDENDPQPLPNLHFKIMQGNSLLESYKGRDLSVLTEVNLGKPGTLGLQSEEAKSLISSLRRFYNVSDHSERQRIFNDIINNVRRQIHELTQSEEFMTDIREVSATDKFFLWHTWFADVFAQGGFDIIIGNPPYLKERDNKHIFEPVNNSLFGKRYHTGKMDYWFYFMHKAFDICKSNACVSFITSRYWINSAGAKKLIKRIKDIATIQSIVDIGSLKVFDNVVGHHMITLRMSKQNSNCNYYLVEEDIKNIISNNFVISRKIPQKELITKKFEISVAEVSKAHGSGKELCDFCDIAQGVVEASDRISSRMLSKNNLSGFNVGDGIFVLSEDEKANLNLSIEELSVLGEYLGDGCLSRFCIKHSDRQIIYSDKTVREKIATMPEFSRLKAHLDRMSPFITSSNKPYGLHRPRNKSAFTSKKIIGPSMFKTPSFAIDDNGIFAGMSYNIVVPFKPEDIEWILAVLNSKYAENWFNNNAKHRGIGNDVGVEKLRSFPMPIEHYKSFNQLKQLVLLIMNGKQDLIELENQIDHIVYHLYDLTYDEVLIVDPETPITREQYESFNTNTYAES